MDINKYWLKESKIIEWEKIPSIAFRKKKDNYVDWFPDGNLNIYFNCVTSNILKGLKKKIAIHYINKNKEFKSYSYKELDNITINFSKLLTEKLKRKKKGNNSKVIIHGSSSMSTAVSMMACAKLGIHFSVIFEDLAAEAISRRIDLIKPDLFITRFSKENFEKNILTNLKNKGLNLFFFEEKLIDNLNKDFTTLKFKYFNSNRDLFTLFTSGSTGIPKGIVHSSGGYMVATKFTCKKLFGMKKNSVIITASNAGWLNGHTYALFGPLSLGATTILLEDPMLVLDENLLKKILKLKVSILYLPVTIIRLMKSLFKNKKFKTSYLKTLGSMGEHLAPSVAEWFAKTFTNKNNSIVNAYYQTENGAIIFSPTYKDKTSKIPHGSVGKPSAKFLKINNMHLDKKKEIKLITPWPGNMKRIINGKKEWKKYWDKNGHFRMFDLGTMKNNNLYVHGRNDDVINVRGHRIGCEEIESMLLQIESIYECCVISLPDELEGEKLYYFIVSKNDNLDIKIRNRVVSLFGSFALPYETFYIDELPKTRSGKILRRLLRSIILNPKLIYNADLSVVANKRALDKIVIKLKDYGKN